MACHHFGPLVLMLFSAAAVCCDLNNTEPVSAKVPSAQGSAAPRQVLLRNNSLLNLAGAPGILTMHGADNAVLLGQLTTWPTATGRIATIKAQPAVLDVNYDGNADAIYAVDVSGLVWFAAVDSSGFAAPKLVADFSTLQAEFNQPLHLVQYSAATLSGVVSHQVMLLLFASTAEGGDILLAVKHQLKQSRPVDMAALIDRTDISADEQRYGVSEQLWQTLQHGAGWYIRLTKKVTALPQVYAGVVYFAAADSSVINPDCSFKENTMQQFYAVHLHHAGLVYARRQWLIDSLPHASLMLVADTEGQLQLVQQNEVQQQSLITDLLAISEECADCIAELNAGQFPRVIRLATFQTEPGAH